jgi:N-acetylmuramoyl-L-alanine amidase
VISSHRLTTAPYVPSPNVGGALSPSLLILHYTVSWPGAAVVRAFQSTATKASAHLVLDLDGMFTQMVPFDTQAWHAGVSEWKGRKGCNGFALGIEIVNPGPVFRRATAWKDINERAWSLPVESHDPPKGFPKTWTRWASYTEAQLVSLEAACRELCREYAITEIVGHSDVSPGRKFDPGPAFPMGRIRRAAGLDGEDTKPYPFAPPIDPATLPLLQLTLPRTTGKHVVLLQERLRHHTRIVTVDGTHGPATDRALVDFQKGVGLVADGLTTRATWEALLRD